MTPKEIKSIGKIPKQYIDDVLNNRVVVCKAVRQAVERHVRDLKEAGERGYYFDEAAGAHAIQFYSYLRHWRKEWAGQPFVLEPWQRFLIWVLFGWKRTDDLRRFSRAYIQIARKNGKTTLAGILGLYFLLADNEPGAEIYSAATKKDQARYCHQEASRMLRKSPDLMQFCSIFKDNICVESTGSKFEPLSSEADTLDGSNVLAGIIDEYHAHKTSEVHDVIDSGMASSRQPMTIIITTAGFNLDGPCHEEYLYSKQILDENNEVENDAMFIFITELDEDDDWRDESAWIKANPNLGVSVKGKYLKESCARAQKMPGALNEFLTKHMNRWVQQETRWISLEMWNEQPDDKIDLELFASKGYKAHAAIDLASVSDMLSWTIAFDDPEDEDKIYIYPQFWCPAEKVNDHHNRYRNQYAAWERDGWLKTTPGNATDYNYVLKAVIEDLDRFNFVDIRIDTAFEGYHFAQCLEEEIGNSIELISMRTNMSTMTAPCNELERRLLKYKLCHGGNPILRWMAGNVQLKQDATGTKKMPVKPNEQSKIDGIVTLCMCLDGAMRDHEESIYETRGLLTL